MAVPERSDRKLMAGFAFLDQPLKYGDAKNDPKPKSEFGPNLM